MVAPVPAGGQASTAEPTGGRYSAPPTIGPSSVATAEPLVRWRPTGEMQAAGPAWRRRASCQSRCPRSTDPRRRRGLSRRLPHLTRDARARLAGLSRLAAQRRRPDATRAPRGGAPTCCEPAPGRAPIPQRPAVAPHEGSRSGCAAARTVTLRISCSALARHPDRLAASARPPTKTARETGSALGIQYCQQRPGGGQQLDKVGAHGLRDDGVRGVEVPVRQLVAHGGDLPPRE